jgi:hypothetical protein
LFDIAYRKHAIDTALAAMGDFAKLVYPYLVGRTTRRVGA